MLALSVVNDVEPLWLVGSIDPRTELSGMTKRLQ